MSMGIIDRVLDDSGFKVVSRGGLVHAERADGARVAVFTWSNPKRAEAALIPRSYLCIDLGAKRHRLPTVQWRRWLPVRDQTPRPAREICEEFAAVFGQAASLAEPSSHPALAQERYQIGLSLPDALAAAGMRVDRGRSAIPSVVAPSGARYGVYGEAGELVVDGGSSISRLTLDSSVTWDEATTWVVRTAR